MHYFIELDLEEQNRYSELKLAKLQLQNYKPKIHQAHYFMTIIYQIISKACHKDKDYIAVQLRQLPRRLTNQKKYSC